MDDDLGVPPYHQFRTPPFLLKISKGLVGQGFNLARHHSYAQHVAHEEEGNSELLRHVIAWGLSWGSPQGIGFNTTSESNDWEDLGVPHWKHWNSALKTRHCDRSQWLQVALFGYSMDWFVGEHLQEINRFLTIRNSQHSHAFPIVFVLNHLKPIQSGPENDETCLLNKGIYHSVSPFSYQDLWWLDGSKMTMGSTWGLFATTSKQAIHGWYIGVYWATRQWGWVLLARFLINSQFRPGGQTPVYEQSPITRPTSHIQKTRKSQVATKMPASLIE